MRVLVLNSGSSSLNFLLLDILEEIEGGPKPERTVASGVVKGVQCLRCARESGQSQS